MIGSTMPASKRFHEGSSKSGKVPITSKLFVLFLIFSFLVGSGRFILHRKNKRESRDTDLLN